MAITESTVEGVGIGPATDPARREAGLGPGIRAFVIALVCAVVVYVGSYLFPVRYMATESLYFVQSQEANPLMASPEKTSNGDVSIMNNAVTSPLVGAKVQTALGILDSRSCAAFICSKLGMARHYGVREDKAVEIVRQRLRADTDKDGFVKIDFDDTSKAVALQALEAARTYLGMMSHKLSLNLSEKNRAFVEEQLAEARVVLDKRKQALSQVLGRSPTADPELLRKNYIDLSKELDEAEGQAAGASAEIASSERLYRKVFMNALDFPGRIVALGAIYKDLTVVAEGLQRRQVALVDAASKFNPTAAELHNVQLEQRNVDKIVDRLVSEQKKDLNEGVMPVLGESKAKLAALEGTVADYRGVLSDLAKQYTQASTDAGNIEVAKRDFSSAELRVTTLENDLMSSKIAEERNPERFEVVDAPYDTGEVAFPKRSMFAFIAFVVVLAVQLVFRPATSRP